MKIYLSDYWRKSSLFNLCSMIFIIISSIFFYFYYWSGDGEDYLIFVLESPGLIALSLVLLNSLRFLRYVIIEEHLFHGYSFFNKKLCTLDTAMPTYYAIFKTTQGFLCVKQFIVLSNESFIFQDNISNMFKKRFIARYDLKKQIVLPYDEQTIPLLNIEGWHKVN